MFDFRLVRQLWMFLAVAEEQNFGRAARRLNMSQPPLTEQIRNLERALGLRLFERSRQGTRLSPAGAAILPAVRQFAGQAERLDQVVREVASGRSGVLRIGSINSAMMDTIPPLLERLKAVHPDLTVILSEIDSAEAVSALESGDLDLAFVRVEGEMGGGIMTLPLKDDRLAVALPRDHPLAALPSIRLESLADEQWVMSSRKASPIYFDMLVGVCRTHGFSPRVTHEVRSVTSQIAYVGCGQGVALVPASLRRIAPENVVVRPLKQRIMVVTAAMAWRASHAHPAIATAIALCRHPFAKISTN